MDPLPLELREKPFTLRQAIGLGISRHHLAKLIAAGVVEQLARGVYRALADDFGEEEQYRVATLRVGEPSAICLISALSHYGLTDTIPKKTWIMVPNTKRSIYRELKLLRTRNPEWGIGIAKHDGYSMTTVERTIVDSLIYKARIGTQIATEALRRATSAKATTLGKIMDMAQQLGVAHRVRPYVEALS